MTNFEIIEALGQITKEKNIDREFLIEILETSILAASKKKFGLDLNIEIKIDDLTGHIEIYCYKTAVDSIENPNYEIQLRKAQKIDPRAEIGSSVKVEIPFEQFGRNAVQNIRQMVIQRIREAEREKVYKEYGQKYGEIVTGVVQQIDKGNIIMSIGARVEAVLPTKEQIKKERFYQGDTVRAVIVEVNQAVKGPQVVVSRSHDDFLRRLFELEVPEIAENMVQIKSAAREPGQRAKIAVHSVDPRIDPVGACVGYKGSRVQAIVRELNNERIDIVPWHIDPKKFVGNALSPAKISNIIVFAEKRKMSVVVDDDQLSLAIGKAGQNARLAAKLTNWKLDLLNKSQYDELLKEARESEVSIREIPEIQEIWLERLIAAGFETVQDLEHILADELVKQIEDLDLKTAQSILAAVDEKLDILDEENARRQAKILENGGARRDSHDGPAGKNRKGAIEENKEDTDDNENDEFTADRDDPDLYKVDDLEDEEEEDEESDDDEESEKEANESAELDEDRPENLDTE